MFTPITDAEARAALEKEKSMLLSRQPGDEKWMSKEKNPLEMSEFLYRKCNVLGRCSATC